MDYGFNRTFGHDAARDDADLAPQAGVRLRELAPDWTSPENRHAGGQAIHVEDGVVGENA